MPAARQRPRRRLTAFRVHEEFDYIGLKRLRYFFQDSHSRIFQAAFGMVWQSPRGPISIDPDTRNIVQDVYIRRVERVGDNLYNVEFAKYDPSRIRAKSGKRNSDSRIEEYCSLQPYPGHESKSSNYLYVQIARDDAIGRRPVIHRSILPQTRVWIGILVGGILHSSGVNCHAPHGYTAKFHVR